MFCCIVGRILSMELKSAKIQDLATKEIFDCVLDGDEALECQPGDQGCFSGRVLHGEFRLKRCDIRRFLDPLYEEDAFRYASSMTLIQPINDPFPEMYLEFIALEKQRLAEEAAKQVDENGPKLDGSDPQDSEIPSDPGCDEGGVSMVDSEDDSDGDDPF